MKSFLRNIAIFKNKLTSLSDNEPVTKLALALIILLDIFILSIIFAGLADHTQQLTSPNDYFPYQCRQAFIDTDWTPANKVDKLQQLVLSDYNRYSYKHDSPFTPNRIRNMHPLCGQFYEQARLIAESETLKGLFVGRQQATKKKSQFVKQYDQENEVYDTKLLENIANRNTQELSSMKASLKSKAAQIDKLNGQIKGLEVKINNDSLVRDFWALARLGDGSRREDLIAELNRFERIYLFKEFMWQLLFLTPLLAIFCGWHTRSVKKSYNIQAMISAHLIVVACIPIVIKVAQLVLELIPHHFFKELFDLFERLHIIALWHYFVILLAVGIVLFFVFIIQKKIFNKARLYEKRLSKGICYACGKILPEQKSAACPFCGTKQLRKCMGCGADTYITGVHCTYCGEEQTTHPSL